MQRVRRDSVRSHVPNVLVRGPIKILPLPAQVFTHATSKKKTRPQLPESNLKIPHASVRVEFASLCMPCNKWIKFVHERAGPMALKLRWSAQASFPLRFSSIRPAVCLLLRLVTAGVMHFAQPRSESTSWSLRACPSCWISCLPAFSSRWLAALSKIAFFDSEFNAAFQIRRLERARNLSKSLYWN